MTNTWARRFGALAAVALLAACSHSEPVTPNTAPAQVPAQLNEVSAAQLMDAIVKAGLPAPNRRDTTAVKCPKLHCVQSIDSDTVSVLKFPGTGPAQLYAAAISNVYQVEDVVLTFAPTVTAAQKQDYERAVDRAAF
jgi:hypothetical protein